MVSTLDERRPLAASAGERSAVSRMESMFKKHPDRGPKLVGPEGEEIDVGVGPGCHDRTGA